MNTQALQNIKKKETYSPFEGYDTAKYRFKIAGTSKRTIRRIAALQAGRSELDDQSRAKYAAMAGFEILDYETKTIAGEQKKLPVYNIIDKYDEYHFSAFLAQEIFEGCPPLVELEEQEMMVPHLDDETIPEIDFKAKIVNEDLFDALLEGEVNAAFLHWNVARGGM